MNNMKTIETGGITYIELIPYGTDEWYYGISYEHGDLYEAEEVFKEGQDVEGRNLCLIHYPDGEIYRPVPKQPGIYPAEPVYHDGSIYILSVDFLKSLIQILRFDCNSHEIDIIEELPEIIWPEKTQFEMGDHDSFYLRDGDKLYFSRWYEEGDDADYRYWEETVVRDLTGEIIEVYPGDVRKMPNGEMWHLK